MNPTPTTALTVPPAATQPPRRVGLGCTIALVIFGLLAAGMIAVAVAAYNAFHLGDEARGLRNAARDHFEPAGSWHPMVEVRLGPVLCGLFREAVIRAADDPDATLVLRAARTLEVGVYGVDPDSGANGRAQFLSDATKSMSARGWTRVVTVMEDSATVLVFMPTNLSTDDEVEFGVLVHEEENVVVAVARAKLTPLLELVHRHMPEMAIEK